MYLHGEVARTQARCANQPVQVDGEWVERVEGGKWLSEESCHGSYIASQCECPSAFFGSPCDSDMSD